jgi:hypothetical protein
VKVREARRPTSSVPSVINALKPRQRRWLLIVLAILGVITLVILWQSGYFATKPSDDTTVPHTDPAAARAQLDELVIKPRGTMTGYSREKYPHWSTVEGSCDTRETVLKRDAKDARTDAQCRLTAGHWHSPYDGGDWTNPQDIDIDHMVPLGQSWVSGASSWTQERRQEFANDLTRPQLFSVTDNVNQSKSDRAPDEWKPPLVTYWCQYATDWITVKRYYTLTITTPEKSALADMLNHC